MVYEWQKWKQGHHVGVCMIVDGGRVMMVDVNISKCILDKFWIESIGVEDWIWGLKKKDQRWFQAFYHEQIDQEMKASITNQMV